MKYKNYLNELTIKGKHLSFQLELYESFLDFMQDYYNTDVDIIIKFRKPSKSRFFGEVNINEIKSKKYVIYLENTTVGLLPKIAHEYTHIKQILKGDLDASKDGNYFIWRKNYKLSVNDYKKINSFDEYQKIPWEKEAYDVQDKLPQKYMKSNYFKLISNTTEPNLRYILDNNVPL